MSRFLHGHSRKTLQGLPEVPNLDLNVLPPVLPQRRANVSVTKKVRGCFGWPLELKMAEESQVWRKIVPGRPVVAMNSRRNMPGTSL